MNEITLDVDECIEKYGEFNVIQVVLIKQEFIKELRLNSTMVCLGCSVVSLIRKLYMVAEELHLQ